MKPILIFLAVGFGSCTTLKSGLTIPANQTFLLGEGNDKTYAAEFVNKSNFEVTVKTVDRSSGNVNQTVELRPNIRKKVYISRSELVYVENNSDREARLNVKLSKGVEGMRYIEQK